MVAQDDILNTTLHPGHRKIAGGIHFMRECIVLNSFGGKTLEELGVDDESRELHGTNNVYVISDENNLMFDTWTPLSTDEAVETLDDVLNGEDLDYLVISHPEANHAGNAGPILDANPNATLVAPGLGTQHELYGLGDDDMYVEPGDTLDLGEHVIEFREPTFFDHSMSIYMYERTTDTIFTVDWFGFHHLRSACLKFADEFDYDINEDLIREFVEFVFFWLKYADRDEVTKAIEEDLKDLDPSIIAPAHGPIIRQETDKYISIMESAIHDVIDQGIDQHVSSETRDRMRPF